VRMSPDGAAGNRAQMSFSHGEHGCPYPAPELAEVIAKTSIEVLLDRLPDLTLAVPAGSLEWRPSVWVRGLTSLPVTFTPVPRRARCVPRQKCGPGAPKARCGLSVLVMSNSSGRSKTVSSRFAEL